MEDSDWNSEKAKRRAHRAWYCVIQPDHWVLARWDVCSALLLCLVCFLTPLEAGFLPCAERWSARWVMNNFVTLFFLCDLILQFFLPFTEHTQSGSRIQQRKSAIVKNYLMTWFVLDFLSVFPFGLLFPCNEGGNAGVDLGVVRAVRLLRLLKLLRLLRGLRLATRWQMEFGYSLRKTVLYSIMVAVVVATHWIACALGFISRFPGRACSPAQMVEIEGSHRPRDCVVTWLSAAAVAQDYHSSDGSAPPDEISVSVAYTTALHASMSILVHPHTYHPAGLVEQGAFIFLLLVGGFVWTQVISRTTAIRTSLSKHENQHQTTMDDLNMTMSAMSLSPQLRRRQRKFFLHTRDVVKQETWTAIVRMMSPKLRRDLNRETNKTWVMNIRFLVQCPCGLIISDLAQKLSLCSFSEAEIFGERWHLYIVKMGSVMLHTGKVVPSNGVWGEDHMLLSCGLLVSDIAATALIFVQCHSLSRPAFQEVICQYPDQYAFFRQKTVRLAVVRGVRLQAERLKKRMRSEAGISTRTELDEATQEALCLVRARRVSHARMDRIQPPTPSPNVMPSTSNLTAVTDDVPARAPERTPEPEPEGTLRVIARGSAEPVVGEGVVERERGSREAPVMFGGTRLAPGTVVCSAGGPGGALSRSSGGSGGALSPVPLATLQLLSRTVDSVAEEQRALALFVDQQFSVMERKIRVLTDNATQAAERPAAWEASELIDSGRRTVDAVYF